MSRSRVDVAAVEWRIGGLADHPHLRTFVCTDHLSPGSEPWAEEVERWLNSDLNLPGVKRVRDVEFHCGYFSGALAAVATWRPDHEPNEAYLGAFWYGLPAIAVSWPMRGKGGALADEALRRVLAHIDAHALSCAAVEISVIAKVHRLNMAATYLFQANSFDRFPAGDSEDLLAWLTRWPGQSEDSPTN